MMSMEMRIASARVSMPINWSLTPVISSAETLPSHKWAAAGANICYWEEQAIKGTSACHLTQRKFWCQSHVYLWAYCLNSMSLKPFEECQDRNKRRYTSNHCIGSYCLPASKLTDSYVDLDNLESLTLHPWGSEGLVLGALLTAMRESSRGGARGRPDIQANVHLSHPLKVLQFTDTGFAENRSFVPDRNNEVIIFSCAQVNLPPSTLAWNF